LRALTGWAEQQGAYLEFGDSTVYNVLFDSIYLAPIIVVLKQPAL
jgi:hypothetical protein